MSLSNLKVLTTVFVCLILMVEGADKPACVAQSVSRRFRRSWRAALWMRRLMLGACWLAAASLPPHAFRGPRQPRGPISPPRELGDDRHCPPNWCWTGPAPRDRIAPAGTDPATAGTVATVAQTEVKNHRTACRRPGGRSAHDSAVRQRTGAVACRSGSTGPTTASGSPRWNAPRCAATSRRCGRSRRWPRCLRQLPPDRRPAALVAERAWGDGAARRAAYPRAGAFAGRRTRSRPAWREVAGASHADGLWSRGGCKPKTPTNYRRAGVAADCAIHRWSALEGHSGSTAWAPFCLCISDSLTFTDLPLPPTRGSSRRHHWCEAFRGSGKSTVRWLFSGRAARPFIHCYITMAFQLRPLNGKPARMRWHLHGIRCLSCRQVSGCHHPAWALR